MTRHTYIATCYEYAWGSEYRPLGASWSNVAVQLTMIACLRAYNFMLFQFPVHKCSEFKAA